MTKVHMKEIIVLGVIITVVLFLLFRTTKQVEVPIPLSFPDSVTVPVPAPTPVPCDIKTDKCI